MGVVSLLTGRQVYKDVQLTTAYANLAFRTALRGNFNLIMPSMQMIAEGSRTDEEEEKRA